MLCPPIQDPETACPGPGTVAGFLLFRVTAAAEVHIASPPDLDVVPTDERLLDRLTRGLLRRAGGGHLATVQPQRRRRDQNCRHNDRQPRPRVRLPLGGQIDRHRDPGPGHSRRQSRSQHPSRNPARHSATPPACPTSTNARSHSAACSQKFCRVVSSRKLLSGRRRRYPGSPTPVHASSATSPEVLPNRWLRKPKSRA